MLPNSPEFGNHVGQVSNLSIHTSRSIDLPFRSALSRLKSRVVAIVAFRSAKDAALVERKATMPDK
jgi:hypothetical protein